MAPPVLPSLLLRAESLKIYWPVFGGEQTANDGLLRALYQAYSPCDQPLRIVQPLPAEAIAAEEAAQGLAMARTAIESQARSGHWRGGVEFIPEDEPARWAKPGVLFRPEPMRAATARRRHLQGAASIALCGITHSVCAGDVLRHVADLATAPFQPWDALICTTQAVRQVVDHVLRLQLEFLAARLRLPSIARPLPQTPVIPLGIHTQDFSVDDASRAAWREGWCIAPDEVVVVFVGRLHVGSKANPLAMYLACAEAARRTGRRLRVIECGWLANETMRQCFDEAARAAGIQLMRLDGRMPGMTRQAYGVADIFVSLSDNVLESFGLTPIEAMAAGLPVLVTDWDGYRDSVRHGVEGFLIPTAQPALPQCAEWLPPAYEAAWLSQDAYLVNCSVMASVDLPACSRALVRLVEDEALRRRMGQAGRERASQEYDWAVVMRQYQALWNEQAACLAAHA